MVPRGVPRGDRHDGHPDSLGTVVEAESAREEPVAEGDVQQVAAAGARGDQRAGHDFAPDVEVSGAIRGDRRLALGAGRGVDPRDLSTGHRQEAERVLLAKIRLADERQARQIRERTDRRGAQPPPVKRNVLDGPAVPDSEPLELASRYGAPRASPRLRGPEHHALSGTADPPPAAALRVT